MTRASSVVLLLIVAGCGANGPGSIGDDDAPVDGGPQPGDGAHADDAAPTDSSIADAGPTGYQCEVFDRRGHAALDR
jgi:hypothetical protein